MKNNNESNDNLKKEDVVISSQAAAKKCFVSARTIRNWIQQHELKAFQTVGGQYKIRLVDLEEFVRKNNMLMKNMGEDIKKRILCVDDDADILDTLSINLKAMGYRVETAKNGIEAGTKAVDFKPDLILLDMVMPEMDGFETIKYFKNYESTKKIPIIALTGLNKLSDIEKIYATGADSYVSKPIKIKELSDMIKRILNII
ncbi:response regulator [Candidatus Dependentiae bacterium]|nr:response regulator [Candidatus Dependentiae bacterium]